MCEKIKATCCICGTIGYIPEEYQGNIKCHNCKSVFRRTGNPISIVRKQLLEKLIELERLHFSKAEWIGGDEHSCKKCKSRNGKSYSIGKMREILFSNFCDSDPFEQGCRCTIGAYSEKKQRKI
ncbi:MAG TPA: hypothetical protein HPP87_01185 [Planctomycetes bacterium]|nr:hypothetical protein [Planctomycetota bacterium]